MRGWRSHGDTPTLATHSHGFDALVISGWARAPESVRGTLLILLQRLDQQP